MIAKSTSKTARSTRLARWQRAGRQLLVVAAVVSICLFTTSAALAAKKKPKEAPPEEKGYVLPYFVVIMIVGVGLMAVCRPASRQDKTDEMNKKDKDDD